MSRAHSIVGYKPDERPENDFYPTPPHMTQALLRVEKFKGPIWECACGDGAISRVLEENGYSVISTDIEPRGYGTQRDFLWLGESLAPNIGTNPPFKLLNEFIEKATSLNPEKIFLLAKLAALETIERSHILERTKLTRVWIFRERQTMWRNGIAESENGGMIPFCWLIWERGYRGKPEIGWI